MEQSIRTEASGQVATEPDEVEAPTCDRPRRRVRESWRA